jgi:c-di-GMP-binding flagellar brake protein YcgR
MTSERRAFLRVEADLTVTCQRIDGAGGLRLADRAELAPGDRAWLEVQFRQPQFLVFSQAEVVWVDDKGAAGVRFDELETYTQQRVIRWVADETGGRLTFGLAFADIHPAQQRQLIERTPAAEKRLSP